MSRFWRVSIWAMVAACVALTAVAGGAAAKPQVRSADGRAGQLDKSFGKEGKLVVKTPTGKAMVSTVAPDGSIFLAGDEAVLSFDADGGRSQSFGTNGRITLTVPAGYRFEVAAVKVDSQGRILVAGTTVSLAGSPGRAADGWWIPIPATATVYRFLPNGSPDPSFGEGGVTRTSLNQALPDMSLRPGEEFSTSVYAAGNAGGGGNAMTVTGLTVGPSDRPILVLNVPGELGICRDFGYPTFSERTLVAALTGKGAVDTGFGTDGVTEVAGEDAIGPATLRSGGVAVATYTGGHCTQPLETGLPYRLNLLGPKGLAHPGLPIGGHRKMFEGGSTTKALAVDSRGRILTLSRVEAEPAYLQLRRYLPDGSPDKSFGVHGVVRLQTDDSVEEPSLAVDGAGRALVEQIQPETGHRLTVHRFTVAGRPDASFGHAGTANVRFPEDLSWSGAVVFAGAHDQVTATGQVSCRFGEACGQAIARLRGGD